MPVPSYQQFIEPVLRFLASQDSGIAARSVHDAAARALGLTSEDLAQELPSGGQLYKNRAGWAFDRLKRAGYAIAPTNGLWCLTDAGRNFARNNPAPLTNEQVTILALTHAERTAAAVSQAPSLVTLGDQGLYRLSGKPIARGGQADVFEAERRRDGKKFAFKRIRGKQGAARMRREIEVQSALSHPNVMPIVDWDTKAFTWYAMPLGNRTLSQMAPPVEHKLLCDIVDSVAAALEAAHAAGHPHRDVKPHNIIELADESGALRWVLADWGLTRRPLGETTSDLTRTGEFLGTDGYAAPEAYHAPHTVTEPADIYALGQLIGWATLGQSPMPNVALNAPGPWRRLVKQMTRFNATERIQSFSKVRQSVAVIRDTEDEARPDLFSVLAKAASGDVAAGVEACLLALAQPANHDIFLDELAELDNVAQTLVLDHPEETLKLVNAMSNAMGAFGHRDFNYANVPLLWIHRLAVEAARVAKLDLLENICDVLFPLEARWDRHRQRDTTRAWLASVEGNAADVIAQCVADAPEMAKYIQTAAAGTAVQIRSALMR